MRVGQVRDWVKEPGTGALRPLVMRGVFACERLEPYTILGRYPGRLLTEGAHTAMVTRLRARGAALHGDEYAGEDLGRMLAGHKQFVLAPQCPETGELLPEFRRAMALYINEPSRRYDADGRLLRRKLASNVIPVADMDRGGTLLCTAERVVEPGDELLLNYGPAYDRDKAGYALVDLRPDPSAAYYLLQGGALYDARDEGRPPILLGRYTFPR